MRDILVTSVSHIANHFSLNKSCWGIRTKNLTLDFSLHFCSTWFGSWKGALVPSNKIHYPAMVWCLGRGWPTPGPRDAGEAGHYPGFGQSWILAKAKRLPTFADFVSPRRDWRGFSLIVDRVGFDEPKKRRGCVLSPSSSFSRFKRINDWYLFIYIYVCIYIYIYNIYS